MGSRRLAHHAHIGYRRVFAQHTLHFGRVHIHTGPQNHVLGAPHQPQIAVGIAGTQIARYEPTRGIARGGLAVLVEKVACTARAAVTHQAGLAHGDHAAVFINQFQLHAMRSTAHRIRMRQKLRWLQHRDATAFARSVIANQVFTEARAELRHFAREEWLAGHQQPAQAGE